eukprot:CAMPEP_0198205076 /NCGR_PEP_ID=MMETSP1445-20131203/8557_1 /TAXON_ID=36898 /ORGANISM="Pyramimonas sp., Strain CCMP2087" /LENGTH=737 /DNA_ID=CAMNT_0043877227 /DNA_START=117 /DNA_END=2330 /DNA_ORIENTATION=-
MFLQACKAVPLAGSGTHKSVNQASRHVISSCVPHQLRNPRLAGATFHCRAPRSIACRVARPVVCVAAPPDTGTEIADTLKAVRGNSQGAMLLIEGATVTIGNNDLIEQVDLKLMKGERWAIVGPNGTGKSTLLKAITGQEGAKLTTGTLALHPTCRVGYLEQKGVSGSTKSVREEVTSRMDRLVKATAQLELAEANMEVCDVNDPKCLDAAIEAITDAQTAFEAAGGYNMEERMARILNGLGFKEADYDRLCSDFSGGWQMRIALARLLLSEPELLILDEPTNHLDAAAKKWIAEYLTGYEGTVMIVSHDENLLQRATTSVAEVRNRKLDLYKSRTYSQWETERVEREARKVAAWEKQQEEIADLQAYVDKWGAGTKAKSAQSRLKQLNRIKENLVEEPEGISSNRPRLNLPKPPPCHFEQLQLDDAAFGWDKDPIVTGVSCMIEKGMRVVVRGPNGAGKSTMLRAMAGELALKAGERKEGDGLVLGFFKQDLAQDLPMELTGVEVVQKAGWVYNPDLTVTEVRKVMGSLGLAQDKSVREIGKLSGGEKARVALACFALTPHNMLLLDEPSNHLDVETIESLTEALRAFQGAVVVVSHDRKFCEALEPTHVMTVEDGVARFESRQLTDDDWRDDVISAQACASGEFDDDGCIPSEEDETMKESLVAAPGNKEVVTTKKASADVLSRTAVKSVDAMELASARKAEQTSKAEARAAELPKRKEGKKAGKKAKAQLKGRP